MSPDFLILLLVALPCVYVLGVLVGYSRGHAVAERNLAELTTSLPHLAQGDSHG